MSTTPLRVRLAEQTGDEQPNTSEVIALTLIDRTDTPFDWYEADDLSFHVLLEVAEDPTMAAWTSPPSSQ